jgi:hypothetical protein
MPDTTPRLGLKKPLGNEAFTRAAYNENLDALETVAETVTGAQAKVNAAVAPVTARIDAQESDTSVTIPLVHGAQTVTGGKASAIAFPRIEGRSQVNGLGNYGNFPTIDGWNSGGTATFTATGNVMTVTGNGTISNPQTARHPSLPTPALGDKLFLRVQMRQTLGAAVSLQLVIYDGVTQYSADNTGTAPVLNAWNQLAGVVTVTQSLINNWANAKFVAMANYSGAAASNGNKTEVKLAAIYSIPVTDSLLTRAQLLEKYPYTGTGFNSILNPTISSVQDNLIPAFGGWSVFGTMSVYTPELHRVTFTTVGYAFPYVAVDVEPNTDYVLSGTHDGRLYVGETDLSAAILSSAASSMTFNTGNRTRIAVALVNNNSTGNESHTFTNVMLVKGTVPPSTFKPQTKTQFTAYTRLNSSLDGGVRDEFTFNSGNPRKIKRIERVTLDGSLAWWILESGTGYKTVYVERAGMVSDAGHVTKYDGKLLTPSVGVALNAGDKYQINTAANRVYVSISAADSGWGDAYTPTAAEIKAYFNGWRMYPQESGDTVTYNGTGIKCWIKIPYKGQGEHATNILPTGTYAGWTPYLLQYQLARPVVEDVQTSGALVIESGTNYVTVSNSSLPPVPAVTITRADSAYTALADVGRAVHNLQTLDKWITYNSLSELNIVEGTETIELICNAMRDRSELQFVKLSGNTSGAYPAVSGMLYVKRYASHRVELRFMNGPASGVVREWIGYFDINTTPNFTGWREVLTSSGGGAAPSFRTTNGNLEYSTDNGGTWNPVGSGIYVSSNTVRVEELTERTLTTDNMLVFKFAPKFTGEMLLTYDARQVSAGTTFVKMYTPSTLRNFSTASTTRTPPLGALDVGTGTNAAQFDYRTPLGTVVTAAPAATYMNIMTSISTTPYTTYSFIVQVVEAVPLYLLAQGANGNIKNIRLSYDVM